MKQTVDESLELSLIRDDVPFRFQRRVGLNLKQRLGMVRRAVFFALLTWLPIVVWATHMNRILPGTVDERSCGISVCMFAFCSPYRCWFWTRG